VHTVLRLSDYKNKEAILDCIDDVTAAIEAVESSRDGIVTLLELTAIDYLRITRSRLLRLIGEKA
jgi:hypothetical protein